MADNQQGDISQQIQEAAQQLAQQILQEEQTLQFVTTNGKIFTRFDKQNDIVENQKQIVTDGIWSNNNGFLNTFYTSSEQTEEQKKYYLEIYQSASIDPNSEPQFSIAYGNYYGSGSLIINEDYSTKAIYNQYRMLLTGKDKFNIDGVDEDSIYVININRSRYKDRLDEGNFQLGLAVLDGNVDGDMIGVSTSNTIIQLIDDSSIQNDVQISSESGLVYNIVSGSINEGVYNSNDPEIYGKFYPDVGIILLSGTVLDNSGSFNTNTNSNERGANPNRLFTSISGSSVIDSTEGSFYARNKETLTSTHYFVRIKNGEYNYSNNPSFTTGSYGNLRIPSFINDPKTYVTTVGLYNDRQELLAVSKLSQPIIKSFYNELLIKVKLEF
jgi:hypothetical protein